MILMKKEVLIKMSKKIILKTNILREKGKLYWCGTSEDGYVLVGESDMARGRKKKDAEKN